MPTTTMNGPAGTLAAGVMPGEALKPERMPGHWLLARCGKRVLRPGGLAMTRLMLERLEIGPQDDVVELAPGMGLTAELTARRRPCSFTAIERDSAARQIVANRIAPYGGQCLLGQAEATGLPTGSASVVYGEAFLTMQGDEQRRRIVREVARVLRPGGRYGIHEIALLPEELTEAEAEVIRRDLTRTIHHGVNPARLAAWCECLESEGLAIESVELSPMHLLEPARVIQDEGLVRSVRFAVNVLLNRAARERVGQMRAIFRRHGEHMRAVMLVARKR